MPYDSPQVKAMTPDERIKVECPRCGTAFDVWPQEDTRVLDLDPELGDPGWVDSHAHAECPQCGYSCPCAAH